MTRMMSGLQMANSGTNKTHVAVIETILNCPRVTPVARWLYHTCGHKVRFDWSRFDETSCEADCYTCH